MQWLMRWDNLKNCKSEWKQGEMEQGSEMHYKPANQGFISAASSLRKMTL